MNRKLLEDALYSTYLKFSKRGKAKDDETGLLQIATALDEYMKSGDGKYFSNISMGRDNVKKNITPNELADYLADYFVTASRTRKHESGAERIAMFTMLAMDSHTAKENIKNCFLGKTNYFGNMTSEQISEVVCSMYSKDVTRRMIEHEQELARRTQKSVNPRYGIENLQVNRDLVNYCREEILSGKQIAIQNNIRLDQNSRVRARREYNLNDEMVAVTDIGQTRTKQQDSVLMLYHPKNPKYKFLMVADGMGGSKDGDKASQVIAKQMVKWFESLDQRYMLESNSDRLQQEWEKELNRINDYILSTTPASGSTFVGAIVGEKTTTIASIGDSRCYALGNDNNLYQMTIDDNMDYLMHMREWDKYKNDKGYLDYSDLKERARQKDNLRYATSSNVITNCLGNYKEGPIRPRFSKLNNDSYKTLMLFSDGVTDCLSDAQLLAITRSTSSKNLAKKIVDSALVTSSDREDLKGVSGYKSHINAGKDNTSAVVYNKKDGWER